MSNETQHEWKSRGYWQMRPPEERVKNACIPRRYAGKGLDQLPDAEIAVKAYRASKVWSERGVGMMFVGPNANLAGAALLTSYLGDPERKRMSGFYVDAQLLAKLFYAEMNHDSIEVLEDHDNALLMRYLQYAYDFLVIANFGSEPDTPFIRSAMTGLVGIRYDRMMPTFFCSTDVTRAAVGDRYSQAMVGYFEDVVQVDAGR